MGCGQSSRPEVQRFRQNYGSLRSLALLLLVLEGTEASQVDQHEQCSSWANSGECEANPGFMWKTCESSCSRAGGRSPRASDQAVRCQSWVKAGECKTNAAFMLKTCPSSCEEGDSAPSPAAPQEIVPPVNRPPVKQLARNVSRNLKEEQQRQQEEIKRRAEELRRSRQQNKTKETAPVVQAPPPPIPEIPRVSLQAEATREVPPPSVSRTEAEEKNEKTKDQRDQRDQRDQKDQKDPKIEAKDAKVESEVLKPWQMPAPSDVDDETFQCMREKFEIARQLDDANAREQSVRERAEAAHSRSAASEQRHRECLKDLAEANQEKQRMRAQQTDSLSENYEQRVQELREQMRKELAQETAKLQKECNKREFQLQELARVANKRADQAEAQLAGRATGEDRLQAEQRAAEHAQEAQAAEQARLKIEEAYRAEGTKAAAREQNLQDQLAKAEARVKLLEAAAVETSEVLKVVPPENLAKAVTPELAVALHCEREAEVLFEALQQVFSKTSVLLWAPFRGLFGQRPMLPLPSKLLKLLLWMDPPAESVLEGLAALGGGSSQMKEVCHVSHPVPGTAVCALAWLVACASMAVYLTFMALRWLFTGVADLGAREVPSSESSIVHGQRLAKHLAALFLPVTRFFDKFSVPEDVRRIAERRAELSHSPANQGTATVGASGSEPEPEEILRRPAALEALLAAENVGSSQEPRPSPRFGAPDLGVHDSAGAG